MRKKAILENDVVINLVEYTEETGLHSIRLPLGQTLIDCSGLPVSIGDEWDGSIFTRHGEPVLPLADESDELAILADRVSRLEALLVSLGVPDPDAL